MESVQARLESLRREKDQIAVALDAVTNHPGGCSEKELTAKIAVTFEAWTKINAQIEDEESKLRHAQELVCQA